MKTTHKLAVVILTTLALFALSSYIAPVGRTNGAQNPDITIDEIVASGFTKPVQVTHAGDGSNRLFVVEQPGTIQLLQDGDILPAPFLDLTALTNDVGERGLLGLAFHPEYAANGFLYVNYTRATDGATIVARYTVADSDPNSADPGSALTLLTVEQPAPNHNGGQLAFGPDGYLYIGMGDGGGGGDPFGNGQDSSTLLGAILRIDVDGGSFYAIPADNPYVGAAGRDEIWAIGLRNPWRFSFDRTTGDLYIGDVGQSAWEAINYQAAGTPGGLNWGWNCLEGSHEFEWAATCENIDFTDPIAEYHHSETGPGVRASVTGGFVYRGSRYPALVGRYFYGDFVSGHIWSFDTRDIPEVVPVLELTTSLSISAFGEDEQGQLYVIDWRGGTLHKLAGTAGPFEPTHFLWLPIILRNG
jgi:glucose/arabinose dehydrogenase